MEHRGALLAGREPRSGLPRYVLSHPDGLHLHVGGAVAEDEPRDARDRDLLAQVGQGDREAFHSLFRLYGAPARALALRVCRRPFLAEEVLQDAFLSLWTNPDGYEPSRGSVRAWLFSAVHHRAVDAVRREEAHRRRSERMAVAVPATHDATEESLDMLAAEGEREAVRQALTGLSPEQRQVIDLMYFYGLSQSQIAERLDLPLGTVKSRTLAAMRRLRTSLLGIER